MDTKRPAAKSRPRNDCASTVVNDTDLTPLRLPVSWHEQTEHEVAAAYWHGFEHGVVAASRAMDEAIREAVAGVELSAQQVVRQLIRDMDRMARQVRP